MKNIGRVLNIGMEFVAAVAGLYVMISGGQEYVIGIKNRDYRKMISGALTFAYGRGMKELACEVMAKEVISIIDARKGGEIRA